MENLMVRLAKPDDLDFLVAIYNQAIRSKKATGHLKEFKTGERASWLQNHQPDSYPVYVAANSSEVVLGYCVLSPWRPGRAALDQTAEISYYVDYDHHGKGIGTALITHALNDCPRIGKKNLLAILQEWNISSVSLLEKLGFEKWGYFPQVVNINGNQCGQWIYGVNLFQKKLDK